MGSLPHITLVSNLRQSRRISCGLTGGRFSNRRSYSSTAEPGNLSRLPGRNDSVGRSFPGRFWFSSLKEGTCMAVGYVHGFILGLNLTKHHGALKAGSPGFWPNAPVATFCPGLFNYDAARIRRAELRMASTSSRGFKTFASPPQLKIQRSISTRLDSFIRNSTPLPFNSRSCCDSCHFFSRM